MHSVVKSAGGLTIMGSFDLDRLLDVINRRHITKFYAVPTLYYRMLALDNLAERIAPVRYCFSAAAKMAGEGGPLCGVAGRHQHPVRQTAYCQEIP
jgi:long-chain acyl-CoA synthetase